MVIAAAIPGALSLFLLLCSGNAWSDVAYDEGSSLALRPYKKGVVKAVRIVKTDERQRSEEVNKSCKSFTANGPLVREFISKATQISAHEYWHENTWSQCVVKGSFSFVDGRRGRFVIQQQGLGLLSMGSKNYHLLCESCGLTGLGANDPVETYLEDMKAK